VKHYFLPRDKIIYTYVVSKTEVVNGKKKEKVTDFLSFYSLPSHVMNNPKHNMLYVLPSPARPATPSTTSPRRSTTNS
jgi:glycylpeptide N-tetradecanoyltransferase